MNPIPLLEAMLDMYAMVAKGQVNVWVADAVRRAPAVRHTRVAPPYPNLKNLLPQGMLSSIATGCSQSLY